MRPIFAASVLSFVATLVVNAHSARAQSDCEAAKNYGAGKFAVCAAKAEKRLVATGSFERRDADVDDCRQRLVPKWTDIEEDAAAAGVSCLSTGEGEQATDVLDGCARNVGDALSGGGIDASNLVCIEQYGVCDAEYAVCTADLAACQSAPNTCEPEAAACMATYAACDGIPTGRPPLQTGQTINFGAASDGATMHGALRSFVDNGDGTITDNATGLMWEKKDDSGGLHDRDNGYTWCADANMDFYCDTPGSPMDGQITTVFLASLNAGGGFAGHTDWRIPNRFELQTLANFGAEEPVAFPEFDSSCTPGCTVLDCSCTRPDGCSTSTTVIEPGGSDYVWTINFHNAAAIRAAKVIRFLNARAVRGPL